MVDSSQMIRGLSRGFRTRVQRIKLGDLFEIVPYYDRIKIPTPLTLRFLSISVIYCLCLHFGSRSTESLDDGICLDRTLRGSSQTGVILVLFSNV